MSFELSRSEGVADGVTRAICERLDQALEQLGEPGEEVEEAVHSARKNIKKSRSAIRLVRDRLPKQRYRNANHRLRDAGRALSDARDATVTLATLRGLRQHFSDEIDVYAEQAIAVWEKSLGSADSVASEARDAIPEAVELIKSVRDDVVEWDLGDGGWSLVSCGLKRSYSSGRDQFAATRRSPSDEQVHEWRKRVKDLWYQLRLLGQGWPGVLDELAGQAHELADLLGDHHDLSLLSEGLADRQLLAEGPAQSLRALVERRRGELLDDATPLAARLYAEKPKAFERRIRTYWAA